MSLELIRASIRQTVEKHGDTLKRAAPSAITISLPAGRPQPDLAEWAQYFGSAAYHNTCEQWPDGT